MRATCYSAERTRPNEDVFDFAVVICSVTYDEGARGQVEGEVLEACDVAGGAGRREKELDGTSVTRDQQMPFEAVDGALLAGDRAAIGRAVIEPAAWNAGVVTRGDRKGIDGIPPVLSLVPSTPPPTAQTRGERAL